MARTSNVFARVEPEIKDQAEEILDQLGIPMSNAIGMFLRQVIIHNGIPFEMKLPVKKPLVMSELSKADFDREISKGISDIES
ncbi:MAG: type II toxin-antitoxin system RelB/DinJ family antitoxin [Oscillospiraceae bacterium]|nr:type II toxin-antitoxin system RelB/DinJ family antitoxin [Oscillospiraceae bacterium]